jgi:hypothetical protein
MSLKINILASLIIILFSACVKQQSTKDSKFDNDNFTHSEITKLDSTHSNIVYFSISECLENCDFEEKLKTIDIINDTLYLSFSFEDTGCLNPYFCNYEITGDTIQLIKGKSKQIAFDSKGNSIEVFSPCICFYEAEVRIANVSNQVKTLKIDDTIIMKY